MESIDVFETRHIDRLADGNVYLQIGTKFDELVYRIYCPQTGKYLYRFSGKYEWRKDQCVTWYGEPFAMEDFWRYKKSLLVARKWLKEGF